MRHIMRYPVFCARRLSASLNYFYINMRQVTWTILVLLNYLNVSTSLNPFHEGSRVLFRPESEAELFGFCVILHSHGLIVGAPKAPWPENPAIKPGGVFNCSTQNLDVKEVTCHLIPISSQRRVVPNWYGRTIPSDFFKDDMWFGATIVFLSDRSMLINAPRWTTPYGTNHLLANGVSYLRSQKRDGLLYYLNERNRQAYVTDGRRREYGEYGNHLNYYAYAQAGFSTAITKNNTVILGAPGLLQWTGGIVSYTFDQDDTSLYMQKQATPNPYYTKDIGPDDYFGYSVDCGVFEKSGRVLYIGGAPRSKMGYGQVLVFEPPVRELESLKILAKIQGSQLGSYFGASLCCTDLNGDGLDDLLVGAPMYVKKDGGIPHDQGAVFVYLTEQEDSGKFILKESGHVAGSEVNGARFGTTIADLGDIDGDGFIDIAIGSPWENGHGVVYIYRSNAKGLRSNYVQKIETEDGVGFGLSISKGVDVDHNGCHDLAIGSFSSKGVYLYRSIHTLQVHTSINVPDAMNLPQNATGFMAIFCVTATPRKFWPHAELNLVGRITVDLEGNRAMISGDSQYKIRVKPSQKTCDEQNVEVKATADLSKPISIVFEVEPAELMKDNDTIFLSNAVRLSEDSTLKSSFLIQLVRDCGADMVCTPWLVMELEALDNPYIPGSSTRLGVKVTVSNKEEPAYGAQVNVLLPFQPKRVPSECSLLDLNMTCIVPSPLNRNEDIEWEIEMEYHLNKTEEKRFNIKAQLTDALYRNVTDDVIKELVISVTPVAKFNISGKSLPNVTLTISRDKFNAAENITFKHYFEIRNHGPSDWYPLRAHILLPDKINLSGEMDGCKNESSSSLVCEWSVPANMSLPVIIPLHFDMSLHGEFMQTNTTYNATTSIFLHLKDTLIKQETETTFILEPAKVIWPIILASVIAGLLLLALIIYGFKKLGFFMRKKREELKNLQNAQSEPARSTSEVGDESTTELLPDEDDSD